MLNELYRILANSDLVNPDLVEKEECFRRLEQYQPCSFRIGFISQVKYFRVGLRRSFQRDVLKPVFLNFPGGGRGTFKKMCSPKEAEEIISSCLKGELVDLPLSKI